MAALVLCNVEPSEKRLHSARVHIRRLETSPLYIRRQHEAALTHQAAKLSAMFYLDAKYQPRLLDGGR